MTVKRQDLTLMFPVRCFLRLRQPADQQEASFQTPRCGPLRRHGLQGTPNFGPLEIIKFICGP